MLLEFGILLAFPEGVTIVTISPTRGTPWNISAILKLASACTSNDVDVKAVELTTCKL